MKKIADAKLKNDDFVEIYHSQKLITCNATELMLRCYAELIKNKFNLGNTLGLFNDCQTIWVENKNVPIGGICFSVQPEYLQAWINFSFTSPEWLRYGVNSLCHFELEKIMKSEGLKYIGSHVHMDNLNRIKSCESVGMTAQFYRMSKAIL
jgi:hypothetical protein